MAASAKDCGQVVQVRRHFIVLRPECLLKDHQRSSIDGFAFVISLESIENRRVGDGVEQGLRGVFAKQSPRNLPSFAPWRFGGREVSPGMENATDIVIDDAAGQAVLAVQFDDGIKSLLVQVQPLVEAAASLVENGEIIPCVGYLL